MRVIVAGSRTITSFADVAQAIRTSGFNITCVVCGYAKGADMLGLVWAQHVGIASHLMPARWREADGSYHQGAGFERNHRMAEYADALVAVWDGESKGTAHMIKCMEKQDKPFYVYTVPPL